jgi:hypothetical protein
MIALLKYLLPALLIVGFLYLVYHNGYIRGLNRGKELEEIALKEQSGKLINQCNQQKQMSYEVSNEYQNNLSGVDKQLDNELRGTTSLSIVSDIGAGGGHNAGAAGQQSDRRVEIPRTEVLKFAGRCEKDRLQIIALQTFIRQLLNAQKVN